jgi:hypothetical protein
MMSEVFRGSLLKLIKVTACHWLRPDDSSKGVPVHLANAAFVFGEWFKLV